MSQDSIAAGEQAMHNADDASRNEAHPSTPYRKLRIGIVVDVDAEEAEKVRAEAMRAIETVLLRTPGLTLVTAIHQFV